MFKIPQEDYAYCLETRFYLWATCCVWMCLVPVLLYPVTFPLWALAPPAPSFLLPALACRGALRGPRAEPRAAARWTPLCRPGAMRSEHGHPGHEWGSGRCNPMGGLWGLQRDSAGGRDCRSPRAPLCLAAPAVSREGDRGAHSATGTRGAQRRGCGNGPETTSQAQRETTAGAASAWLRSGCRCRGAGRGSDQLASAEPKAGPAQNQAEQPRTSPLPPALGPCLPGGSPAKRCFLCRSGCGSRGDTWERPLSTLEHPPAPTLVTRRCLTGSLMH